MNEKGFTVLEAVIALALCGLLLGGLLPVAYQLLLGAERHVTSAEAMDEAELIDRTLYWAITNADGIALPSADTLSVTGADGGTTRFAADGSTLMLSKGAAAVPLNVSFQMTNLAFTIARGDEGEPRTVTAAFTLGPTPFLFRYSLPPRGLFPSSCMRP